MKLEFPRQIFEEYSKIKYYENPFSGHRDVPCGRTDRHDEVKSHFSQFCERAQIRDDVPFISHTAEKPQCDDRFVNIKKVRFMYEY